MDTYSKNKNYKCIFLGAKKKLTDDLWEEIPLGHKVNIQDFLKYNTGQNH